MNQTLVELVQVPFLLLILLALEVLLIALTVVFLLVCANIAQRGCPGKAAVQHDQRAVA